jgi:predicted acetyltransferase
LAERRGVKTRWEVPSTIFWYVAGAEHIGTLVIRHRLTAELFQVRGHSGYDVVAPWQGQGHATRMLATGLDECRRLGLHRVLLTCAREAEASRRAMLANGGVYDDRRRGEDRNWIDLRTTVVADASRRSLG